MGSYVPVFDVVMCWSFIAGRKVPGPYEVVTPGVRPKCPHMVVAEEVTREEGAILGRQAFDKAVAEAHPRLTKEILSIFDKYVNAQDSTSSVSYARQGWAAVCQLIDPQRWEESTEEASASPAHQSEDETSGRSRAIDQVTLIEAQPTQKICYARFVSNETWHVLRNVDHRTFAHYIRDEQTLYVRIKDFTDDKLDQFSKQASDAQIVHWYVIRLVIEAARKDHLDILAIRGTENVHAY